MNEDHKYDDIIGLEHHVSGRHPMLGMASYAAQFAPFAALTGYDGIVDEAARFTQERVELGESDISILNRKLNIIAENINENPEAEFVYYKKDDKKSGGNYLQKKVRVKRIDEVERILYFTDGSKLLIDDIVDIKGEIFKE